VSVLIVAVDTSGKKGSVALCRDDKHSFEVLRLTPLEGGTYSAQLMPRIAEALQQNQLTKTDVDAFVVVSGPGSFTGLRVGLATVKGLCEVLGKPLATVSMLETVALTYGKAGQTLTVAVDAGRGEVYVGEYGLLGQCAGGAAREYIARLDEFATKAKIHDGLLTPDAKIAEALRASNLNVTLVPPVWADQVGRIGLRKVIAGDLADLATVDVNYIRRSDAEIFSTPKH
jgi:tRNA threonylcarbamoyladenosine biosynthesis protein TsaB